MTQEELTSERGKDFKLERYKYILQQLHALNEGSHRYLLVYQTLATAIIGAVLAVFVAWKDLKIDANAARLGIRGLMGLLTVLTIFVILVIVAGIASWIDYRREEVKLLDTEVEQGFRQPPRIRNFWRWHEIHIILFLILVVIGAYLFIEKNLLAVIQ